MQRRGWAAGIAAVAIAATMAGCALPDRRDAAVETRGDAVRMAAAAPTPNEEGNAALLRSVQQALNDRGFAAGAVDGRWGTPLDYALRRFQLAQRLPPTGDLDVETMAALGIAAPADTPQAAGARYDGAIDASPGAGSATTRALPAAGTTTGTAALPPPMTSSGATPSGMTTPGATNSGAATRPAAGTPPGQNTGTPARAGTP